MSEDTLFVVHALLFEFAKALLQMLEDRELIHGCIHRLERVDRR